MGTLANGIKDIFSTSQTTATHLPVCASDGTPQGRISVGDLASVLGANMKERGSATSLGDFDLVVENGYYTCNPQSMANKPNTLSGQASLWVWGGGGTTTLELQILWDNGNPTNYGKVFMRTRYNNAAWKDWVVVGTDYPLFYKNYADLSSLASALGDGGQSAITDCDDVINAGTYTIATNAQHHPTGVGTMVLEVHTWSGFVKQVATRAINGEMYIRTYDANAVRWTSWYKISLTTQS